MLLVVLGSLGILLGLAFLAAGGVLTWALTTQRDSDGFYSTSSERLSSPTFALSKEGQEMVRSALREPARGDVESASTAALKGFKRVVIGPDNYHDYKEYVRLYQEIFRTR